jgi:hypothetical protein
MDPMRRRRVLRNPRETAGSEWEIREIRTTSMPGAKGEWCLICDSAEDGVVRRVWNYPRLWYELSDEELRGLCEG